MRWKIMESNNYLEYMQEYKINALLAKIADYKKYNQQMLQGFVKERLIYHDFSLFSEGEMALERIHEAIENQEKICIYGDYDCDGILATTILVDAFQQLGVTVGYHIPDRKIDGYGLNVSRVEQMADKGYSLIITVDNGIKAFDAIEKANELGIDVIVTDHHNYDTDLPDACCMIHTKLSPEYPFKEISGGFVAYKLASALLEKNDKYLYCLAAITTVSDMMPLVDENRSLVKKALTFMKEEKYPALELLLGENQEYTVQSLGFIIAPKINSFGRLSEMVNPIHVVRFLLRDAPVELLSKMASHAITINAKRQEITTKQYKEVLQTMKPNENFLYSYQPVIHEGIIGLVAGKYTREFYRPSFVMHFDTETNMYKGSARGIKELPLTTLFEEVKDLLDGYGGHSLAGGFSVSLENVKNLKQAIANYITTTCPTMPEATMEVLKIDQKDVTKENIKSLDILQPLGTGNEETIFYLEDVQVEKVVSLSDGKHIKFEVLLPNSKMQALCFNKGTLYEEYKNKEKITVIGKFNINTFRNMETINMIVDDIK